MSIQLIGMATKPQALKGQFRIKPEILNLKTFKKLKSVKIEDSDYVVESVSLRDTFVIIKLKGIDTCEQAETFRNKKIYADIEITEVESHFDLSGFSVVVDDCNIGLISEVNNYGSKDIISIFGTRNIMLPVVDGLIKSTNTDDKIVVVNKKIMDEVAVYED